MISEQSTTRHFNGLGQILIKVRYRNIESLGDLKQLM